MRHCQSQLVSYKVQWFCSLAGLSRWSALFLFCSSSPPLQMLFPAVLFFLFFLLLLLIPFLKSREKAVVLRARRCGLHYYSQLQLRVCSPSTCSGGRKPADFTASALFDGRTIHYLHLLLLCNYIYSFSYLPSAQKNTGCFCFIKQSTNSEACRLITLPAPVMKTCSETVCSGYIDMAANRCTLITDRLV